MKKMKNWKRKMSSELKWITSWFFTLNQGHSQKFFEGGQLKFLYEKKFRGGDFSGYS
jgi:hypothetical protein